MAPPCTTAAGDWTVADLLARFGPIAHRRVRQDPAPGSATEQDVVALHDRENRLYELVDGVLVEKSTGIQESYLEAGVRLLWYVDPAARRVEVFTSAATSAVVHESDALFGEPVLPGFVLPLRELFARLGQ
jgi:hypothetical protein